MVSGPCPQPKLTHTDGDPKGKMVGKLQPEGEEMGERVSWKRGVGL